MYGYVCIFSHQDIPLDNNPWPGLATSPFFRIERLQPAPVYTAPPAAACFSFPSWCEHRSRVSNQCEEQKEMWKNEQEKASRCAVLRQPAPLKMLLCWSDWICHCGSLYRQPAANRSAPFHRLPNIPPLHSHNVLRAKRERRREKGRERNKLFCQPRRMEQAAVLMSFLHRPVNVTIWIQDSFIWSLDL